MSTIHEIKTIFKLTAPLLMAFLAQKSMQFIDTVMMGWIGPEALAAGALGTAILFGVMTFCRGTISSVGVYISFSRGANNAEDIKSSLQNGIYLALLLGLPGAIFLWFAPNLLSVLGQNPHVIVYTKMLLHGLAWGLPGCLLFYVLRETLAAFGHSHATMWVAFISIPLTFLVNYILIYGKYGFPALGIEGIGLGSAFVFWFMFFALLVYTKMHHVFKDILRLQWSYLNFSKISEMFFMGMPSGILGVLDVFMFLVAALFIGYFGVTQLAAFQITMQWASIAYNVPLAFSVVAAIQVGHAVGAKNHAHAKRVVYLNLAIGTLAAAIISLFFIFTPELLVKAFLSSSDLNQQAITHYAIGFLFVAGIFQCADAIQCMAIGVLRGFKDTVIPMILGFGCYLLLGISSAYLFAFYFHWDSLGVWYGLTLGIFTAAVILLWRLFYKLKTY